MAVHALMRDRMLHRGSQVCLVLGVMASLLWCRSWFQSERFERSQTESNPNSLRHIDWILASDRGNVWAAQRTVNEEPTMADGQSLSRTQAGFLHGRVAELRATEPWATLHRRGFAIQGYSSRISYIRLPWAAVLWLLCMVPGLRVASASISPRRRKAPGCRECRICGYDLRATPQRCPECGTLPQAGTPN